MYKYILVSRLSLLELLRLPLLLLCRAVSTDHSDVEWLADDWLICGCMCALLDRTKRFFLLVSPGMSPKSNAPFFSDSSSKNKKKVYTYIYVHLRVVSWLFECGGGAVLSIDFYFFGGKKTHYNMCHVHLMCLFRCLILLFRRMIMWAFFYLMVTTTHNTPKKLYFFGFISSALHNLDRFIQHTLHFFFLPPSFPETNLSSSILILSFGSFIHPDHHFTSLTVLLGAEEQSLCEMRWERKNIYIRVVNFQELFFSRSLLCISLHIFLAMASSFLYGGH